RILAVASVDGGALDLVPGHARCNAFPSSGPAILLGGPHRFCAPRICCSSADTLAAPSVEHFQSSYVADGSSHSHRSCQPSSASGGKRGHTELARPGRPRLVSTRKIERRIRTIVSHRSPAGDSCDPNAGRVAVVCRMPCPTCISFLQQESTPDLSIADTGGRSWTSDRA